MSKSRRDEKKTQFNIQSIAENQRQNLKQTVDFVENNPMNLKTAALISIFIGVIISLLTLWAHIDIETFHLDDSSHIGLVLPMNIFMSFAIYTYGFYILRSDRHLVKRIITLVFGVLLIAVAFSTLTSLLSRWIYKGPNLSATFNIYAIKDVLAASLAILIIILLSSINRRHHVAVEMERLKTSQALLSYEMLQKQLDPHFLFNTLTILDNLIGHDDAKAKEYLHHLVTTFRMTSEGGQPHTLREEMDRVESYKYIMKVRFGNSLDFEEHIDSDYLEYHVVYFSVHLLIENVVKHNIISEQHPMTITISTTDHETLVVSNPLQLKKTAPCQQGLHLGLSNLDKRYMILFGKHIKITGTADRFMVEIPLISSKEAESAIEILEKIPLS